VKGLKKIFSSLLLVAVFASINAIANADSILDKLGAPADSKSALVHGGDVQAVIKPSIDQAAPGQDIGVTAEFTIAPGWHIYGNPLPKSYTPTSITFDNSVVAKQSLDFPKPEMVSFASLGETLPVYKDSVHASGKLMLRPDLKPGDYNLTGKVSFQECSDTICKMPRSIPFAIPITIAAPAPVPR
jgi:DsbC/DsbD-like thiol-disulfide interchange protein